MDITKKRVQNVDNYLIFTTGRYFRISSPELPTNLLNKLDLKMENLFNGFSVLPRRIGPVSTFNADGRFILLKKIPREIRCIGERTWTWKDWGGNEHSTTVDISRRCYQREFIEPPSKEITFNNNKFHSEILDKNNKEEVRHTINLFLELFGSCELVQNDLTNFPKIERMNWEILPSGENPFENVLNYIRKRTPNKNYSLPIENRHEFLFSKNPEKIAVGTHGFSGYVMYYFEKYLILDCIKYGNAIYVFDKAKENICSLSKKEVLDNELNINRVIHNKNWKSEISKYFSEQPEKEPSQLMFISLANQSEHSHL